MAGMGKSGVPDIIACFKGHFLAIEAKAGNNKPTSLQEREINNIKGCGGYAMVINESNLDELEATIKQLSGSA